MTLEPEKRIRQNYLKIGGCGFHLFELKEQLNILECISLTWNGDGTERNFARKRCGGVVKSEKKEEISGFIWDLVKSIFENNTELQVIYLEDLFSYTNEKEFTDLWFGKITDFIKNSYNKERIREDFCFKRNERRFNKRN